MIVHTRLSEQDKEKYRYHYAALLPLFKMASESVASGDTILYLKKRWNPQRDAIDGEYESLTLKIQLSDIPLKLEAWIYNEQLIILIINSDSYIGWHPSENYHLDINNPYSIDEAATIITRFIDKNIKNHKRTNPFHLSDVLTVLGITAITTLLILLFWRIICYLMML